MFVFQAISGLVNPAYASTPASSDPLTLHGMLIYDKGGRVLFKQNIIPTGVLDPNTGKFNIHINPAEVKNLESQFSHDLTGTVHMDETYGTAVVEKGKPFTRVTMVYNVTVPVSWNEQIFANIFAYDRPTKDHPTPRFPTPQADQDPVYPSLDAKLKISTEVKLKIKIEIPQPVASVEGWNLGSYHEGQASQVNIPIETAYTKWTDEDGTKYNLLNLDKANGVFTIYVPGNRVSKPEVGRANPVTGVFEPDWHRLILRNWDIIIPQILYDGSAFYLTPPLLEATAWKTAKRLPLVPFQPDLNREEWNLYEPQDVNINPLVPKRDANGQVLPPIGHAYTDMDDATIITLTPQHCKEIAERPNLMSYQLPNKKIVSYVVKTRTDKYGKTEIHQFKKTPKVPERGGVPSNPYPIMTYDYLSGGVGFYAPVDESKLEEITGSKKTLGKSPYRITLILEKTGKELPLQMVPVSGPGHDDEFELFLNEKTGRSAIWIKNPGPNAIIKVNTHDDPKANPPYLNPIFKSSYRQEMGYLDEEGSYQLGAVRPTRRAGMA